MPDDEKTIPTTKEIEQAMRARLQQLGMERRELERAKNALDPNRRGPGRPPKNQQEVA